MEITQVTQNDNQYISPSKLCRYLESSGWVKKREAQGISVWVYNKQGKPFGILVPLNEEFADYNNRISEVISTLEEVEGREQSKILQSLQSVSLLAKKNQREVIELWIRYQFERKYDINIKKMGSVLKSLQDFFQSLAELRNSRRQVSIKNIDLRNQVEVSLIETFQGSFGFRIAFSKTDMQLALFDFPIAEDISQDFLDLIRFSNIPELLAERISNYRGKPSSKFKTLIFNILSLEANLYLEWGSVKPEKGGFAEISYENLVRALDILEKQDIIDPVLINFVGTLILAGVDKKKGRNTRFIAVDEQSGKEYRGSISESIVRSGTVDLIVGKIYRMTLEEKSSVNAATGDEEISYTLIDLIRVN